MKKNLTLLVVSAALLGGALTACAGGNGDAKTHAQEVVEQAMTMDKEELYKKAMEEVNGKTFYMIANSSRTPTAATAFVQYCQDK